MTTKDNYIPSSCKYTRSTSGLLSFQCILYITQKSTLQLPSCAYNIHSELSTVSTYSFSLLNQLLHNEMHFKTLLKLSTLIYAGGVLAAFECFSCVDNDATVKPGIEVCKDSVSGVTLTPFSCNIIRTNCDHLKNSGTWLTSAQKSTLSNCCVSHVSGSTRADDYECT